MNLKKIRYSIGQAADSADLPQSVLRYWETVFDSLNPLKSPGGNRQYSEKDIELIFKIKELLYVKGFTIKGANALLNEEENISEKFEDKMNEDNASEYQLNDNNLENTIIGDSNNYKEIIKRLKEIIKILDE